MEALPSPLKLLESLLTVGLSSTSGRGRGGARWWVSKSTTRKLPLTSLLIPNIYRNQNIASQNESTHSRPGKKQTPWT